MVEPIHPTANQYGTDVERVPTTFRDFLAALRVEEGPHPYLTTQYSEDDPDAETVFPPPTNALKDEFPIVPRIMGNLFLQQVNLWLGRSKDGSSSGLHHDFHDNIYCLLKGRKRFVLFPPSEVKHLYPYGTLVARHPNGLISYEDIPVRADGLSKRAACKARVRALELKIDALKRRSKGKGKAKNHSKEMKALMDAHDEALDELAEAALDEHEGDDEVDDFDALMSGLDDLDDLDDGPSRSGKGADEGDEDEDEEEEWKGIGHSDNEEHTDDDDEEKEDSDEEEEEGLGGGKAGPTEPSSFSRIATAHLHQHLGIPTTAVLPETYSPADFPGLKKTTEPYVVELSEGEMLYLPASWWHEVTSTSTGDVHMAFNYWFYPPDALDNFGAPYSDTLVWDYLRGKGAVEGGSREPEELTTGGKRARESVGGGPSKKSRR
ncbi:Clavaminate synthase-like protein [Trametes versicolor FP-101664 SS1]|uniref:Clavaminate synthase-like protein n=1 Tax=Trametes versicolor (strain FP-101664) TaxID=717944 RepID=UPI00046239BD|nr:Clavaminate synthase-like protein [Trametes versicolor FP-101664 SS1]EIW57046.1 Clavaminate synthase-like protein [Trametes versicolor FP-101664 SS1]